MDGITGPMFCRTKTLVNFQIYNAMTITQRNTRIFIPQF